MDRSQRLNGNPLPSAHPRDQIYRAVSKQVASAPSLPSRVSLLRFGVEKNLSEEKLLRRIRRLGSDLGLGNYSDEDLRASLTLMGTDLRANPNAVNRDDRIAHVFAIVNESVQRRLGSWRIFDPAFDRQSLAERFPGPQPGSANSTGDSGPQAIAAGIAYWEKTHPFRKAGDILLPGEFYCALNRQDTAGQLQFRPTDAQLLAGLHLFRGKVAEMNAGEGKTVAIAFPAVMHALLGRSVHIITANDYLADRDCARLTPVFQSLGISVDAVLGHMDARERQYAYRQQVVYGTMREFAFDFLRDNLALSPAEQVQSPRPVAIIDEVDQALIDEARTPMIISGSPLLRPETFNRVKQAVADLIARQKTQGREYLSQMALDNVDDQTYAILLSRTLLTDPNADEVPQLIAARPKAYRKALATLYSDGSDYPDEGQTADLYYLVDPEERFVTLTARGVAFLEESLGNLYAVGEEESVAEGLAQRHSRRGSQRINLANQAHQLLRAYLLLKRDVDYLVEDDSVVLIDRDTGRAKPDSRYQNGLQSALEAKESVTIHPECESLAQISVQGFALRYAGLCGITGTAVVSADEFQRQYNLEVVAIPTTLPMLREDLPCRVYANREDQLAAIADTVMLCRQVGRPVLVGVQTVRQSAQVSEYLSQAKIEHRLLNAVTSHDEAEIVRGAGAFSAVTVATNMAGRGTDILLEESLNAQILESCLGLIRRRLARGNGSATLRCARSEEADQLVEALSRSPDLIFTRRRGSPEEVTVAWAYNSEYSRYCAGQIASEGIAFPRASSPKPFPAAAPPGEAIEFGLGLYVINAEFSQSFRAVLQLKGRSGRQGQFGATRSVLAWHDRSLARRIDRPKRLARNRKTDAGGRVYWEGKQVERYLRRLQAEAEWERTALHSVFQDYAAIADAHSHAYYRVRGELMRSSNLSESCALATRLAATRLVESCFPGGDSANYAERFAQLAKELGQWYGLEASGMYGLALDELPLALEDRLNARWQKIIIQLGPSRFTELARLLRLQSGDETWRDCQASLLALTIPSRLGNYGHKSAVADYIIHAAENRRRFQADAADYFLSRLLTFPLSRLLEEPSLPEEVIELDREASFLAP